MACKCSPSLKRLMADFAARGHVNSGCCGDAAHAARRSDHNPDASGYAHAQDVHELADHDMQPYVDFIMVEPTKFPQVKYLIYEGHIYYPHDGARKAGRYVYTGPNDHAHHLHVSIFADFTHYGGNWHVAEAYDPAPKPPEEDDEMKPYVLLATDTNKSYLREEGRLTLIIEDGKSFGSFTERFGAPLKTTEKQLDEFRKPA